MKYSAIVAILGISFAAACTTANSNPQVITPEREQQRVLSETEGKGPGEKLNAAEQAALERARAKVAEAHAVAADALELVSMQHVEWSDSSLGCPKPGVSYMQVITPGHRVILKRGSDTYRVHVANKRAIVCGDLAATPFQRPVQVISAQSLDRMREQARANLARQFSVPVEEIEVGMIIPSQWPDASLGCPEPGVQYPPRQRNGFRILLKHRDRVVAYHTDGQRVFPCPPIEME